MLGMDRPTLEKQWPPHKSCLCLTPLRHQKMLHYCHRQTNREWTATASTTAWQYRDQFPQFNWTTWGL